MLNLLSEKDDLGRRDSNQINLIRMKKLQHDVLYKVRSKYLYELSTYMSETNFFFMLLNSFVKTNIDTPFKAYAHAKNQLGEINLLHGIADDVNGGDMRDMFNHEHGDLFYSTSYYSLAELESMEFSSIEAVRFVKVGPNAPMAQPLINAPLIKGFSIVGVDLPALAYKYISYRKRHEKLPAINRGDTTEFIVKHIIVNMMKSQAACVFRNMFSVDALPPLESVNSFNTNDKSHALFKEVRKELKTYEGRDVDHETFLTAFEGFWADSLWEELPNIGHRKVSPKNAFVEHACAGEFVNGIFSVIKEPSINTLRNKYRRLLRRIKSQRLMNGIPNIYARNDTSASIEKIGITIKV